MSELRLSRSPAFRLAVLLTAGILMERSLAFSPGVLSFLLLACAMAALSGFFLSRRYHACGRAIAPAAVLVCLLLGAAKFGRDSDRSQLLPDRRLGHEITVVGSVVESPHVTGKVTRFLIEGQAAKDSGAEMGLKETVRVSVTREKGDVILPDIRYGMTLALRGRLSRPSDTRNPGEFSEKQYYEANGITLFLLVHGGSHVVVCDSAGGNWLMRRVVNPLHDLTLRVIDETTEGESAEYLKGLLIGERSGISVSTRQAFTNSGVAHILAVSGSNVVFVAAVFSFLFGLCRLPKWGVVLFNVLALGFYMLVTGSQPPVVRATVMSCVFLIGTLVQRRPNPYNTLGMAAAIILAADTRQLFDIGFQLSFAAVLSIVYLYPKMNRWISFIRAEGIVRKSLAWVLRVCAVSLAATLGTLPLTVLSFEKVSLIGLLANVFVVPAAGASVVLGFVTIFASAFNHWIAQTYGAVNQLLLDVTLWVIRVCGALSYASVEASRFAPLYALPFYSALLLLFNLDRRGAAKKYVFILLLALNIAVFSPAPAALASGAGNLRVSFLDVGQGDASVFELPGGQTMVIDAGPGSEVYDAGERIVAPFLRRRGISRIDLLILSHPHDDHCGGAPYLVRHFEVVRVLETPFTVETPLLLTLARDIHDDHCTVVSARAGMSLKLAESLRAYIVAPSPTFVSSRGYRHYNLNNTSVVARIQYGDVSFLLAGDAEKDVEHEMVREYGDFLRSNVLKAGHHGSSTSSSPEFLDVVHPAYAVISVGLMNRFGHPSDEVLARLHALPSAVCRTDDDGAVIFETDGTTLTRVEWR